jgi:hypothetical protein
MSTEMLNVMVSVATLLVVGAAATAALIQLRHLRTSNQLTAFLGILNQWNLPVVQAALRELKQTPGKMGDPEYVAVLRSPGSLDRASHPEFLALDLWEQVGTYSKHGLIDEKILLDIISAQVRSAWRLAQPLIAVLRESRGPSVFENFEYLAVRAKLWEKRNPSGLYPAGLPRFVDLEA